MRRKHILLALVALLAGLQTMDAIPAHPGKFKVKQPDGSTLVLQKRGDEWGHWLTDASGQMVRKGDDGFYRIVPTAEADGIRKRAADRRSAVRETQSQSSRRSAPMASGTRRFLVILVEFDDEPFSVENPRQAFTDMLNEPGYSQNDGTGSARDYYYDNSHGAFEPVFEVYGPVKLDKAYSYYGSNGYGDNDSHCGLAVVEGCEALDDQIDFSRFDNDGDGKVDMVFMYYAGYGEQDSDDEDRIWPKMDFLSGEYRIIPGGAQFLNITLDGVILDRYACANEKNGNQAEHPDRMSGIGTACHEFGHVMGLPDFYDTDYQTKGYAGALYGYSLMCEGGYNNDGRTPPYFNFVERIMLGWLEDNDYQVFAKTGDYAIPPVNDDVAYRTFTDMVGEYFVYENRTKTGWDRYLPEEGLVVYHVDQSSNMVTYTRSAYELWAKWQETNTINSTGDHPCFYLVRSSDPQSLTYTNNPGYAFPYRSVNSFVPISWSGAEGSTTLSQIAISDGMVTLHADAPESHLDYVSIAGTGSYRAGDRFTFALNQPEGADIPASVVWYLDDEPAGAGSVTLTAGAHTVDARLTYADGRTAVASLEIDVKP